MTAATCSLTAAHREQDKNILGGEAGTGPGMEAERSARGGRSTDRARGTLRPLQTSGIQGSSSAEPSERWRGAKPTVLKKALLTAG